MAKIQLKSDIITPFGGIFSIINLFHRLKLDKVIDGHLGNRVKLFGFQYSQIIESIFYLYLCGGTHIEDLNMLGSHLEQMPGVDIPSPDTVLNGIKELTCENTCYTSDKGKRYEQNLNGKLNELMLELLLATGQLKAGLYDFDFDHQAIETEKQDTQCCYKGFRAYFPGIAQINGMTVGIENRDGNMPVKFHQADTLERYYKRLKDRGIAIYRSRMDCGSYSEDIVRMVHSYSYLFYIRALSSETLREEIKKEDRLENCKDWR